MNPDHAHEHVCSVCGWSFGHDGVVNGQCSIERKYPKGGIWECGACLGIQHHESHFQVIAGFKGNK